MRKTLANEADVAEVQARMKALTGTESARFGTMSVAQMVCHLREAFRATTEERTLTPVEKFPLPPGVIKWLALRTPMQWRPGIKSVRELEPGQPGTVPADFAADRAGAIAAMEEFRAGARERVHPYFGRMCAQDWLRWGYLHADHHLRQFGR